MRNPIKTMKFLFLHKVSLRSANHTICSVKKIAKTAAQYDYLRKTAVHLSKKAISYNRFKNQASQNKIKTKRKYPEYFEKLYFFET
jgi:hypothetical protein